MTGAAPRPLARAAADALVSPRAKAPIRLDATIRVSLQCSVTRHAGT
jgi:hypothetical protein